MRQILQIVIALTLGLTVLFGGLLISTTNAADQDTVTIALTGEPPTMDPHRVSNFIGAMVWRWSYDTLITAETGTGELKPWLAEKWEKLDAKSVKFWLRKDANLHEVPHDGETIGEICARANNVMEGYYKQPAETERVLRGGWFHSGDLAVVHADGYIEIVDREKDVINSGGENISSVEVESMLYEHPAVLEAAVVGVPDNKWGEVPKAIVLLKPGQTAEAQDIITFCRDRMAHFKAPKSVDFVESLPKTATGKIQKFALREPYWEGHEKRVQG